MRVAKAASSAGMHRSTLYRILKRNPRLRCADGIIDIAALRKYKARPNKMGRPYGKRALYRNKRETKSEWEGRVWINQMSPQKMRHALRRWAEDRGFRGQTAKVTALANDLLSGAKKGAEARKNYKNLALPLEMYKTPKDYGQLKGLIRIERRTEPLFGVANTGSL